MIVLGSVALVLLLLVARRRRRKKARDTGADVVAEALGAINAVPRARWRPRPGGYRGRTWV